MRSLGDHLGLGGRAVKVADAFGVASFGERVPEQAEVDDDGGQQRNEGARDKWHVLREVESSMVQDYTLSVFKVTPLGSDAAFVTYEALIHFPAKSAVRFERVYIGEVWVKRDGQWKELHYQETRVK